MSVLCNENTYPRFRSSRFFERKFTIARARAVLFLYILSYNFLRFRLSCGIYNVIFKRIFRKCYSYDRITFHSRFSQFLVYIQTWIISFFCSASPHFSNHKDSNASASLPPFVSIYHVLYQYLWSVVTSFATSRMSEYFKRILCPI